MPYICPIYETEATIKSTNIIKKVRRCSQLANKWPKYFGSHVWPRGCPLENLTIACLIVCLELTHRPFPTLPEYNLTVVNIFKMHGTRGLETAMYCTFRGNSATYAMALIQVSQISFENEV